MVLIRLWKRSDLDYVADSVRREGWRHVKRDIERCWRFEPNGCFIAEVAGKPVGHVFSVRYDEVGWIGLLIVNPENRGRGIGAALMKKAIGYLQERGVETMRLEAVEKAVPLYKRLDFIEEFVSLRFSKRQKQAENKTRSTKGDSESNISDVKDEDVDQIASFDSDYFGVNRLRVLKSLYQDEPKGNCFMARKSRRVIGYIMSRKITDAYWIGPWVCENSETAGMLLRACVNAIDRKAKTELRLGMPALNTAGIRLVDRYGFNLTGKSVRMICGKPDYFGDVKRVYGIGGPEKG